MTLYEVKGNSILVLRIMLSGIFFIAGINHLIFSDKVVHKLSNAPLGEFISNMGSPLALILISGFFMLVGAIALSIGFRTKLVSIGLLIIVFNITISVQIGHWETIGPLFKNIAIIGGLIFFIINGAVCCSVDNYLGNRLNQKK